ncbi:uncharacterized protein [Amphiura filiformis]|uniref:uncharacterized protein n=1 Tax=Amphiura filiformis TaxID=82378 RepID=UPI003B20F618
MPKDKVSIGGKISVFHQLMCIIHKPDFHKTDFHLVGKDYSIFLQKHLVGGSLLEIGNGVTALALSSSNLTLAALTYPEYQMAEKAHLAKKKNMSLMTLPLPKLLTALHSFQSDPQVMFTTIVLSNITALVSNHLPDELESLLSKVFSLAQETYMAFDTNKNHKMETFFSYWGYPEQLLENSCSVPGIISCSVHHVIGSPTSWDRSLWKIVPSKIIRKMPSSVCHGHQECKLVFKRNNDSTHQWLQAQDWKSIIAMPACGMPLNALLQLGLTAQSRESLMTPVLEANINMTGLSSRDLCISRQGIHKMPKHTKILNREKEEELQHQSVLLNQIWQTTVPPVVSSANQHHQFEIHGVQEPPMSRIEPQKMFGENMYPSEELDQDKDEEETFLKKDTKDTNPKVGVKVDWKVNKPYQSHPGIDGKLTAEDNLEMERRMEGDVDLPALHQEVNQEDGVAHLWQREMGVVDDNDRENLKKGALDKMGEQWDRENHQQDHAVAIMSEQYKWAAIDRLWTRDEGDDTDMLMSKGDSKPGMQEGQVYKYDQELGKMIGSLNDNDKRVRMEMKNGGQKDGAIRTKGKLKFDGGVQYGQQKESQASKITDKENMSQIRKKMFKLDHKNPDIDNTKEDAMQVMTTNKLTTKVGTKPSVVEQTNHQKPDELKLQNKEEVKRKREDKKTNLQEILRNNSPKGRENQDGGGIPKVFKRHLLELENAKTINFYTKPPNPDQNQDKQQPAADITKVEVVAFDEDADLDGDDREFLMAQVSEEDEGQAEPDISSEDEEWDSTKLDRKSLYTSEWSQVGDFLQQLKTDAPFSLLTYGLEQQSSLSAKICRSFPNASVVTVIPEAERELIEHHRKLQESLELKNNLLVSTDLPDRMVLELYHLPEVFRFQILGLSVFNKAVSLGGLFPAYLGRLISLAQTTYLEVPPPQALALATVLLRNSSWQDGELPVFKGFIHKSLQLAGIMKSKMELLGKEMPNGIRLLKIDLLQGSRQVKKDCGDTKKWLHYNDNKPITVSNSAAEPGSPLDRSTKAITLKTLLALGLPTLERKKLFFGYFSTGLHKDMCPIDIVWMQGRLLYCPTSDNLPLNSGIDQHKAATIKAIMGLLSSQLDSEPFSFLEYGSGKGSLSIALAAKYTNSTIISMADDAADAESHLKEVKRLGLWNNAITESRLDEEFSTKLVESPDFLHYQFIGLYQYLLLLQEEGATSSDTLATLMGNLLSSAVTTFIQLPSSQVLSLAVATFFPEMLNGTKFVHMSPQEQFLRASHPLGPYRNAEIHLIKEGSFGPSVDVNVSSHVLHPADESLTWSLLRVNVKKLNITVNHHFDYKRDGHQRRYTLHCNSNETNYEVFLIREKDGFKIPYGKISGFSLITLLRMGLLKEMKERLYNLFLHLPLYEDMAPWNIVFQGGSVQYIDYDTKEFTFDKVAPMAYQVMALLMNYERTVEDFGHCNFNAGNQYGFSYISHCVEVNLKDPALMHDTQCLVQTVPANLHILIACEPSVK